MDWRCFFSTLKGVNWGANASHQSVSLGLAVFPYKLPASPSHPQHLQHPHTHLLILNNIISHHSLWTFERSAPGICSTLVGIFSVDFYVSSLEKKYFFDKKSIFGWRNIWMFYILNTLWRLRCKTVTNSVSQGIQEMSELRIGQNTGESGQWENLNWN